MEVKIDEWESDVVISVWVTGSIVLLLVLLLLLKCIEGEKY